jgi:hypothetical protein
MGNNIMSKKYKMSPLPNCKPMSGMDLLAARRNQPGLDDAGYGALWSGR